MNLELDAAYDELRADVRQFCTSSWPLSGDAAALPLREQEILWQEAAIAAKFLHRSVPSEYGGGGLPSDPLAEAIIAQEFVGSAVPFLSSTPNGPRFLVPTLLECGTEDQRRKYIWPTLTGRLNWCQGYSEPGAGSDLASLRAQAVLDGDEWLINGQKTWTSLADRANMMFGLFRTERERERHAGISFLLVPMDSAGLSVRPIRGINGSTEFCEVFFDNVRIPAENIVGKRGEGWKVSKAVLKYERLQLADSSYVRGQFDGLVALARRTRRNDRRAIDDQHIRQRLSTIEGWVTTQEYSVARILTALDQGRDDDVSAELLIGKLLGSHSQQEIARLAVDIIGSESMLEPSAEEISILQFMTPDPTNGDWANRYFASLAVVLGGGTSNIHRNIVGERLLGLPRDLRMEARTAHAPSGHG